MENLGFFKEGKNLYLRGKGVQGKKSPGAHFTARKQKNWGWKKLDCDSKGIGG